MPHRRLHPSNPAVVIQRSEYPPVAPFLLGSALVVIGLLILVSSWFALRKRARARLPVARDFTIDAPGVVLKGVRYANPRKPPVILVHGYAGNSRHWREIGYCLFKQGYDVWMPNLRGHGRGEHRSKAKSGANYGFLSIVAEDFPIFVEHVWEQTGRRATLVGHSLGGVAARAYASGIILDPNGRAIVDEQAAARIAQSRVHRLVVVGSPPHYRNVPKAIRVFVSQVPQLVEVLLAAATAPIADRAPTKPDSRGFTERLRSQIFDKLDGTLRSANFVRGLVELRNFDQGKDEFARLLKKGISKVPIDLVRDVNQWIRDGDVVIGEQLNLSELRKVRTPFLMIAGELDWLGPHEDIIEEARQYRGQTHVRAVLLRRTSHIDLIAGERAGQIVGSLIARFIRDPSDVGYEDRHLIIAD